MNLMDQRSEGLIRNIEEQEEKKEVLYMNLSELYVVY
jgi:hypothetical protein